MALTLEPDVHEPTPPVDGGDDEGGDPPSPWWHSPWRLVVMAAALVFLGGALGYFLTSRASTSPSAASVDVGFLQDMRWHHDQAVRLGLILLDKDASGQDPSVRSLAGDIVRSQQFENGVMAGQLRAWGQAEANESGTGMAWMAMPVPIDRMPGMASEDEVERLKSLSGPEADELFLQLMYAHHEGGLHMATDALGRTSTDEARTLARSFMESQQFELTELQNMLAKLDAS